VESKGTPTVVACLAIGEAPIFRATSELPTSIEGAVAPFVGPYDDCVKGFTVGPGHERPTLARVREYLAMSLEQGWITHGELFGLLDEHLSEAEEAVKASPNSVFEILEQLLADVEAATITNQASLAPEVDALVRMNIEVMLGEKSHYR
tara:strand:- start:1417 stop:1863 length:447 start_codon:yes stop_codon:yes gene_type:complete